MLISSRTESAAADIDVSPRYVIPPIAFVCTYDTQHTRIHRAHDGSRTGGKSVCIQMSRLRLFCCHLLAPIIFLDHAFAPLFFYLLLFCITQLGDDEVFHPFNSVYIHGG